MGATAIPEHNVKWGNFCHRGDFGHINRKGFVVIFTQIGILNDCSFSYIWKS